MAGKQNNGETYLIKNKLELQADIKNRIEIGKELFHRQIANEAERLIAWQEFLKWDSVNREIISQAFNKKTNRYEYEYKRLLPVEDIIPGVGSREPSFKQIVNKEKESIALQTRKLEFFYDKIEYLQYDPSLPQPSKSKSKLDDLLDLLNRFNKIVLALRKRHRERPSLIMSDEYDVQYLLNGLLNVYFDDIRPEEYSPSSAGANSKIDFVLRMEGILLETKMTNERLDDKKIGDELYIDIARYKAYQSVSDFVIFIFDPGQFIKQKHNLINDLQSQATPNFKINVVISPMY